MAAVDWLYGSIAVSVIALSSVAGIVLMTVSSKPVYNCIIAIFIGLAIGCLNGDAVLHLIPELLKAHSSHEDHEAEVVKEDELTSTYILLLTLLGIYGFFLIQAYFVWITPPNVPPLVGVMEKNYPLTESSVYPSVCLAPAGTRAASSYERPELSSGVEHGQEVLSEQKEINWSLVLNVTLSDAIHNFADGLAMGAAFSANSAVGVATSIAVFCHELPHELGDFAILLKCGMTTKQAVVWNLASALTAYIGLIIGLLVGYKKRFVQGVFALTAGMFLYISLSVLLPSLLQGKNAKDLRVLALNSLGILLGTLIMLLLAVFGHDIHI